MKPRVYLESAKTSMETYRRTQEHLEEILAMEKFAGSEAQRAKNPDRAESFLNKLKQSEMEIRETSARCLERFMTIRRQIDAISPQLYSDILYMRYIKTMGLRDIAEKTGYSYSHMRHLLGRALISFAECFPDALKAPKTADQNSDGE